MLVNQYNKNGYISLSQNIDSQILASIKKDIDSFYKKKNIQGTIFLFELDNSDLQKRIISLFDTDIIKDFIQNLSFYSKTKVSVLPRIHIMKNYHVNRMLEHRIGWHRDCAGEFANNYTADKLKSPNYVFGKIGIYLQENSDNYGGAIDIIPRSHRYIKKKNDLLRKLQSFPLFILILIQKKFKKFYNIFPEFFWMFLLSAKKIKSSVGSPVFFDNRLQHRGSPINNKYIHNTKSHLERHVISVPHDYTKISIYANFGSTDGADSLIYYRLRNGEPNIFSAWLKEIEYIKKEFPEMHNSMTEVIDPIYNKYFKSN